MFVYIRRLLLWHTWMAIPILMAILDVLASMKYNTAIVHFLCENMTYKLSNSSHGIDGACGSVANYVTRLSGETPRSTSVPIQLTTISVYCCKLGTLLTKKEENEPCANYHNSLPTRRLLYYYKANFDL